MRWLYAVAALAKGKPIPGLELAGSREDAFHLVEDHAVRRKMNDDNFSMTVLQLPWDIVLAKMAQVVGDDEEAKAALEVLKKKLPAGRSEEEPAQNWLTE